MKELYSDVQIAASAERVWHILTDFGRFPQWNPFIRIIEGEIRPGARLHVFIQPPGGQGMTFHPQLLFVEPYRELRWLGRLVAPGVFDGEHIFLIQSLGNGTVRFVQRETFRGALVPFFWRSLETTTRQGFHDMNLALKQLAEQGDELPVLPNNVP